MENSGQSGPLTREHIEEALRCLRKRGRVPYEEGGRREGRRLLFGPRP